MCWLPPQVSSKPNHAGKRIAKESRSAQPLTVPSLWAVEALLQTNEKGKERKEGRKEGRY